MTAGTVTGTDIEHDIQDEALAGALTDLLDGVDTGSASGAAAGFRRLVDARVPAFPLPGHGSTRARFTSLRLLGATDLVLARLTEGHADATAILAELGTPQAPGTYWGVWAAAPATLTATGGATVRLSGEKPWCSGAGTCTDALVTACGPDGPALFHVRTAEPGVRPVAGSWPSMSMAGTDSRTVRFDDVAAEPVGGPGDYTGRPGFWHGGIGVAACWLGGAQAVAAPLLAAAAKGDPHTLAHLGAVDELLATARLALDAAADRIDAQPHADAHRLARRVRAAVERTATEVVARVGRATGARPLCQDRAHGTRVADLEVYLRQSHAERDLAALGELTVAQERPWWQQW